MNDNFSTTLVKAQQIKDYIKKQENGCTYERIIFHYCDDVGILCLRLYRSIIIWFSSASNANFSATS